MKYYDEEELKELNAEGWQGALLKLNPQYLGWGPHEDAMLKEGPGRDSRQLFETWSEFGPWELDDLNECVNFYFSVNRENVECECCGGDGYHLDAREIVDTFYAHSNAKGEQWKDKITEDEVEALLEAGRLWEWKGKKKPTAAEVNAAYSAPGAMGHDAINRHILIRTRLKRLGITELCDKCGGHGYVFTAPTAHVSLTLWWLHPRKGCSRGIEIKRIEAEELPDVMDFLKQAAGRNAARFAAVSAVVLEQTKNPE